MLHILIASIVLSNWRKSPGLAFFLGLAMHVAHNGIAAIVAAKAPVQTLQLLIGLWGIIYLLVCVTCIRRYDEQIKAARHGTAAG